MNNNKRKGLRTWIEVDKKALQNNYKEFRKILSPDTKMCAVVKSNAYGHGLVDFSVQAEKIGVDYFAVDSITEAIRLRKEGIKKPILVLGHTLKDRMLDACNFDIEITISSFDSLFNVYKISKGLKKKIKVHLKIDTGMHRQGFMVSDRERLFEYLEDRVGGVEIVGVYTHFANAKKPDDRKETEKQIEEFVLWKEECVKRKIGKIFHASATAGALLYPEAHFDMVRIGMGLYGYYPSPEMKKVFKKSVDIKSILSWRSVVSEIKQIPKNEGMGYNFTFVTERKTNIALVPIGYWHGFGRDFSNVGHVLIRGKKYPMRGSISMDMIIVDITAGSQIKVGDVVTIIGEDTAKHQWANEISSNVEFSYYEFLTRINPLIKKIYI